MRTFDNYSFLSFGVCTLNSSWSLSFFLSWIAVNHPGNRKHNRSIHLTSMAYVIFRQLTLRSSLVISRLLDLLINPNNTLLNKWLVVKPCEHYLGNEIISSRNSISVAANHSSLMLRKIFLFYFTFCQKNQIIL